MPNWLRRIGEILLRRQRNLRCDIDKLDAKIADFRRQKHDMADRSQVIHMEAYGKLKHPR